MGFNFQKLITGNALLDRVQTNIVNAFNQIAGPFIGGSLLLDVSLISANPVSINHGLNRVPQVWVITDQDTLTTVKRTAWDLNTITLQSGSDCTVSLWVN